MNFPSRSPKNLQYGSLWSSYPFQVGNDPLPNGNGSPVKPRRRGHRPRLPRAELRRPASGPGAPPLRGTSDVSSSAREPALESERRREGLALEEKEMGPGTVFHLLK